MESGYEGSSSDNEDEVQEMSPPPKAHTRALKFKCHHCSAAFASRKEYKNHSEMHALMPNPNPGKRTLSQREMAMHVNADAPSVLQPPQPTMAVGPANVMNQPSLNLNLPPPTNPNLLSPWAVTLGTDDSVLPPPPGFPPRPFQHREVETLSAKRPRKNDGQVDNKMSGGGTSGAGGSGSSSKGEGGDKVESGGGSNSSSHSGTIKPFADFDLNLPPPEE